jgi:hypothetical protein
MVPSTLGASIMVKVYQSPAIFTGKPLTLVKDILFLTKLLHLPEILRDLLAVIESWIPGM